MFEEETVRKQHSLRKETHNSSFMKDLWQPVGIHTLLNTQNDDKVENSIMK